MWLAALCKVAKLGEVAERRALASILAGQARGHGGLHWDGWWSWDKREYTRVEDLPEALWAPHTGPPLRHPCPFADSCISLSMIRLLGMYLPALQMKLVLSTHPASLLGEGLSD